MVNQKRLLDEFVTLAMFDSESLHEKSISMYLYDKLVGLGLEVYMDKAGSLIADSDDSSGNIYGILKGDLEGEPILFSAHMDTVSPGKGKKVVVHRDGKVTSDGTSVLGADDITGIVAILEMLTVIKEEGLPHPDIEVTFFIAEEMYCKGSSVFDYSRIKSKHAYTLDLDGKIGRIANSAPSIIQFEVSIEGKSAHAGFEPENGISAIMIASQAISGLKLGRVDAQTTVNIGTITGGTGKNIVPGHVMVQGEVRSLDRDAALSAVERIKSKFEGAAIQCGAKAFFTSEEMVRAYKVDENSFVIQRYAEALNTLGLGKPEIITSFGGSDNNNFCQHGIEGVVIANAMNNVHTVNEYFYIEDLVRSSEIVLRLATGIGNGKPINIG